MIIENDTNLLNNPAKWMEAATKGQLTTCPLSPEQVISVQKEIDSIVGLTRDNKPIAKLIWNPDRRFGKEYYANWDLSGKPVGGLKMRPWVLYKSVYNSSGRHLHDVPVPRFVLLTRLEPQQYALSWKRLSTRFCPARRAKIQIRPENPPKEYFMWFQTVNEHKNGCCQNAAKANIQCFGYYAHPKAVLQNLRDIKKGIENSGQKFVSPFTPENEMDAAAAMRGINDYDDQIIAQAEHTGKKLLENVERHEELYKFKAAQTGLSLATLRAELSESVKRRQEKIEQSLN